MLTPSRPSPRPTVVLVDDDELFRTGLRELLAQQGVGVAGEARSADAGLRLVARHTPDVAVVDPDALGLPGAGGSMAIRRIKLASPATQVLALARRASLHDAVDVVRMGGSCYLLKDAPAETILAGVHAAAAGESLIAPEAAAALVRRLHASGAGERPAPSAVLSAREQQILRLLADGKDNDAIAADLYISRHTVKNHISSILVKLEVTNRVQAAVLAVREAMV